MSLALDITADELVFDKTERQPQMLDKELLRNWEKIDDLPDDDKLAVKKIVAAFQLRWLLGKVLIISTHDIQTVSLKN